MIEIRAHHGMCLFYFKGKGYSSDFTKHMAQAKEMLECGNPIVRIVTKTDYICASCPNNEKGVCTSCGKVACYDSSVLEYCELSENCEMLFSEFQRLVKEKILIPGNRSKICGNCQWNELCN